MATYKKDPEVQILILNKYHVVRVCLCSKSVILPRWIVFFDHNTHCCKKKKGKFNYWYTKPNSLDKYAWLCNWKYKYWEKFWPKSFRFVIFSDRDTIFPLYLNTHLWWTGFLFIKNERIYWDRPQWLDPVLTKVLQCMHGSVEKNPDDFEVEKNHFL